LGDPRRKFINYSTASISVPFDPRRKILEQAKSSFHHDQLFILKSLSTFLFQVPQNIDY
jgi:hypothetical protein